MSAAQPSSAGEPDAPADALDGDLGQQRPEPRRRGHRGRHASLARLRRGQRRGRRAVQGGRRGPRRRARGASRARRLRRPRARRGTRRAGPRDGRDRAAGRAARAPARPGCTRAAHGARTSSPPPSRPTSRRSTRCSPRRTGPAPPRPRGKGRRHRPRPSRTAAAARSITRPPTTAPPGSTGARDRAAAGADCVPACIGRVRGRARGVRGGRRAALVRGAGRPCRCHRSGSVFEAVRDRAAGAGVVPVESSQLGTIRESLDLLYEFDLVDRRRGERAGPARAARAAGRAARDHPHRPLHRRRPRPGGRVPARSARGRSRRPGTPQARLARSPRIGRTRARRPLRPPGSPACTGWRSSPTGSRPATTTGRGSRCSRPEARKPALGRPRRSAATAGAPKTTLVFGVRNVPGLARALARGVRVARHQPLEAGVAAVDRPRLALGVRLLG